MRLDGARAAGHGRAMSVDLEDLEAVASLIRAWDAEKAAAIALAVAPINERYRAQLEALVARAPNGDAPSEAAPPAAEAPPKLPSSGTRNRKVLEVFLRPAPGAYMKVAEIVEQFARDRNVDTSDKDAMKALTVEVRSSLAPLKRDGLIEWLREGSGEWRLTEAGREVLEAAFKEAALTGLKRPKGGV